VGAAEAAPEAVSAGRRHRSAPVPWKPVPRSRRLATAAVARERVGCCRKRGRLTRNRGVARLPRGAAVSSDQRARASGMECGVSWPRNRARATHERSRAANLPTRVTERLLARERAGCRRKRGRAGHSQKYSASAAGGDHAREITRQTSVQSGLKMSGFVAFLRGGGPV